MRVWFSLVALAALFFALPVFLSAQQASAPPPGSPQPDTQIFRAALENVSKGKEAAQQAWEALRASTTSNASSGESDFATDWLRTVTPNGLAPTKFYAGTENLLNAWIGAISSGEDAYPPADEIRAAVDKVRYDGWLIAEMESRYRYAPDQQFWDTAAAIDRFIAARF